MILTVAILPALDILTSTKSERLLVCFATHLGRLVAISVIVTLAALLSLSTINILNLQILASSLISNRSGRLRHGA